MVVSFVSIGCFTCRMNADCMIEFMQKFALIDKSRDGVVDIEEFCEYLHLPLTKEVQIIFRIYDIVSSSTSSLGNCNQTRQLPPILLVAIRLASCYQIIITIKLASCHQSHQLPPKSLVVTDLIVATKIACSNQSNLSVVAKITIYHQILKAETCLNQGKSTKNSNQGRGFHLIFVHPERLKNRSTIVKFCTSSQLSLKPSLICLICSKASLLYFYTQVQFYPDTRVCVFFLFPCNFQHDGLVRYNSQEKDR